MIKPRIAAILVLPIFLLAAPQAAAEKGSTSDEVGLVLDFGLWQYDVSIYEANSKIPRRESDQRCIAKAVTPADLMRTAEEQGCTFSGIKLKKTKLSWRFTCEVEGIRATGRGEFQGEGKEAKGKARSTAYVAGQRIASKFSFEAKWLRECTAAETRKAEASRKPKS